MIRPLAPAALLLCFAVTFARADAPAVIRTAANGPWSAAATWEGGKIPAAGAVVLIRGGHDVLYDRAPGTPAIIRSIHIDGVLRFATDRDTQLDVGLIRVNAGGTTTEAGFDCDAHAGAPDQQAALLVGSSDQPVAAGHSALIRLHYVEGMDKESCPAIVTCGGRMEFHGAPLSRTWLKLGAPAKTGATEITLAEPVTGWRIGDRIILTATTRQNKIKKTFKESVKDSTQTEERLITGIDGAKLKLDQPLKFDHVAEGDYRGDVANLSRNVIVESADPAGVRGHTMFHRGSSGSIGYAEFRHLGKAGVLGRYSLHFHLCGDTMRGTSIIGASIWDSDNRWVTIHGTNYLVVRDCVGYQSKGHGYFMEDGTEVNNVLDRNLAVQAYTTKPLPKQMLPFDKNDGSGFWWANSGNAFTRNVAAECDEYGYFFQCVKSPEFDPTLNIRQADGSRKATDIRTIPFIKFEDNESHCQRRHAFNLGGGAPFGAATVGGVGPDPQHPFVIRNYRAWNTHWPIHPVSPSVLLENLDLHDDEYGVWRPVYKDHAYKNIQFTNVPKNLYYAFESTGKAPNDESAYPRPLNPIDDTPPTTVITRADSAGAGKLVVRGTTIDNGTVAKVIVNGREANASPSGEWEVTLEGLKTGALELTALAQDGAGNVEKTPHMRSVNVK